MKHGKMENLKCRLLTPSGTGAIAVVRVSGWSAWGLVRQCVLPRSGSLPDAPQANRLYYGVYDDGADAIDDVVVAYSTACGDDDDGDGGYVDISSHGGVRVVERILLSLTAGGAALVDEKDGHEAGSPWQDRIRQRALHLLQRAPTRRGAMFLMAQARLLPIELERIMCLSESGDDVAARNALNALMTGSQGAHHLYTPADIAIVGPPNAGKSLLASRLAGREGAIVSERAGTTRDWVSSEAAINGVPVTLIDTAGVRVTDDGLENQAIEAGRARTARADLFLLVLAGHRPQARDWLEDWRCRLPDCDMLVVLNKSDLGCVLKPTDLKLTNDVPVIAVSALNGSGLDRLRAGILLMLGVSRAPESQPIVFEPAMLERLITLSCEYTESQKTLANRILEVLVDS